MIYNTTLRKAAHEMINDILCAVKPDRVVEETLNGMDLKAPVFVLAIGKAAWVMADAAVRTLGDRFVGGLVITKYGHSRGTIAGLEILEAGHPVPDENSVQAALRTLELTEGLSEQTEILFLLSGGASALAELPLPGLTLSGIQEVTQELLRCGADITQMNCIRKRLSGLKGGRLAERLAPRKIHALILSDVVGDHPEMIASGPTYPDLTDEDEAARILEACGIRITPQIQSALNRPQVRVLSNAENRIIGSVAQLCNAAGEAAAKRGFTPYILNSELSGDAEEAAQWLIKQALSGRYTGPCALIAGGETTVKVRGKGMGGRNQQIALKAAIDLAGKENILLFSLGSDGTDGPTDAAGGMADAGTVFRMAQKGIDALACLQDNDAYHGLLASGDLLLTGPTGTNVNDVMVALIL